MDGLQDKNPIPTIKQELMVSGVTLNYTIETLIVFINYVRASLLKF